MDTLLRDLREGTTEQRQQAAQALRDYGTAAVEPLCLALRDKDLNVRVVAAESLGQVGDARAVQPLLDALRDCFVFRSSRAHLIIGAICVLLAGMLWLSAVILTMELGLSVFWRVLIKAVAVMVSLVPCIPLLFKFKATPEEFDRVCQSIIDALKRIAEREPVPELRAAIPDLSCLATDDIYQKRQTRNAAREAAQRIETLTEQLKSLPLPAAAPAPDAATLPRAVEANAQETERLPRVTNTNG